MDEEKKEKKKINPDRLKWLIVGLGCFAAAVLIFSAGIFVGGMKARFSYQWAESYHQNFAGPRQGFLGDWQKVAPLPGDFLEAHGAFGEVLEVSESGFIIKGPGEMEKTILTNEKTIIEKGREKISEVRAGDWVTIIGSPNDQGQIEAKLIRVFNQPPANNSLMKQKNVL